MAAFGGISYDVEISTHRLLYPHFLMQANLLFFGAVTFVTPLRLTIPLQLVSLLATLAFTAHRCRLECGAPPGGLGLLLEPSSWPPVCPMSDADPGSVAGLITGSVTAQTCMTAADPTSAQRYYARAAALLSTALPLSGRGAGQAACLPLCFSVHAWLQVSGSNHFRCLLPASMRLPVPPPSQLPDRSKVCLCAGCRGRAGATGNPLGAGGAAAVPRSDGIADPAAATGGGSGGPVWEATAAAAGAGGLVPPAAAPCWLPSCGMVAGQCMAAVGWAAAGPVLTMRRQPVDGRRILTLHGPTVALNLTVTLCLFFHVGRWLPAQCDVYVTVLQLVLPSYSLLPNSSERGTA